MIEKPILLLLFALSLIIYIPSHSEAVNQLTSTSGMWTGTQGSSSVIGVPSQRIYWGVPLDEDAGLNGMSSFEYTPTTYPVDIPLDVHFKIGTFTHYNRKIFGSSITKADLQINVNLTIGNTPVSTITLNNEITHNETSNSSSTPGDIIDMITNSNFEFTVNESDYRIDILGFTLNNELIDSFITQENQTTSSDIVAIVRSLSPVVPPITPTPIIPPPVVHNPEPETYLILGGALLFILWRRGRNNRKQKKTKTDFIPKKDQDLNFWL
jgi:hypothetical protein